MRLSSFVSFPIMNTLSQVKMSPHWSARAQWLGWMLLGGCAMQAQAAVVAAAQDGLTTDWVRSSRPPITVNIQRPNVRVQPTPTAAVLGTVPLVSAPGTVPPVGAAVADQNSRSLAESTTALVLDADRSKMRSWNVEMNDSTVRLCLRRWAKDAGWQLVWDAKRDFVIDAEVSFYGTFEQALGSMMQSLSDSEYPLQARINPDTKVVRIQRLAPSQAR